MKIDRRLFIVFIMVLALIPGACAITASTGGGSTLSGSGSGQGNFVTNGVQTTGYSVASGAMSGTEDHWIGDTTGKHAEVSFNVQNAAKWTHDYSLSPGGKSKDKTILPPQSSLNAQESLDVTNANEIQANANARNGEGDQAYAGVHILGGSIANYKNSATATMTQATASQTANSASGGADLTFGEEAIDMMGGQNAAWVGMETYPPMIQNGQLTGYSGSAIATKNSVTKDLTIASLSGSISFGPYASNKEGDMVGIQINRQPGSVSSVIGYTDHASATSSSVDAKQTASSITSTGATLFGGTSINAENDYTLSQIYTTSSGTVSNPTTTASATSRSGNAQQTASSITSTGAIMTSGHSKNAEGDYSHSTTQITNGQLVGYTDTSTVSPSSASSSRFINYAAGDSVQVGTDASQSVGGESASVLSEVTGGYIFLYSDKSTATLHPSVFPYIPNAEAFTDIKAFGTIDVQSYANNVIPGQVFQRSGKLIATVDSAAYADHVALNPNEWKGLAFMAIQSNALAVGPINPGHAGVGVWNDDGTWTIGSLQGGATWDYTRLFGASVLPGKPNNGWSAHGLDWLDVQKLLSANAIDSPKVQTGNGVMSKARPGSAYDKIKVIKVSDPNPVPANSVMDDFPNRGFWFGGLKYGLLTPIPFDPAPVTVTKGVIRTILDVKYSGNKYWPRFSNDCLDATVDTLQAYGVPNTNAQPPLPYTFPNYYFGILDGTVYAWKPDLSAYAPI